MAAPTLLQATTDTDAETVYLLFDQPLDGSSAPASSAFSLDPSENPTVTVLASLGIVRLALSGNYDPGDEITVAYTKPGSNPLQNPGGEDVETIAATKVTNLKGTVYSAEVGDPHTVAATTDGQSCTVTWEASEDELASVIAYELERSEDETVSEESWIDVALVGTTRKTYKEVVSLDEIEHLSYRVRAVTRDGRHSGWGVLETPVALASYRGEDTEFYQEIFKTTTIFMTPTRPTSTAEQMADDEYLPDGWTNNRSGLSVTNKYEWFSFRTRTSVDSDWGNFSTPELVAHFGIDGKLEESVFIAQTTSTAPTITTTPAQNKQDDYVPTGWSDNPVSGSAANRWVFWALRTRSNVTADWGAFSIALLSVYTADGPLNEAIYFRTTALTKPTRVTTTTAQDGMNDYIPPNVDGNGNGASDNPRGVNSTNKYEWIATRKRASGDAAWSKFTDWVLVYSFFQDGPLEEFVYRAQSTATAPTITTSDAQDMADEHVPTGWSDDPVSPTATNRWLFMAVRKRSSVDDNWGKFAIGLLSIYTADSPLDEAIYTRTTTDTKPTQVTTTAQQDAMNDFSFPSDTNITDDPQGVTETNRYEWIATRKRTAGDAAWGKFTDWVLVYSFGQDGAGSEWVYIRTETDTKPTKITTTDEEDAVDDFLPAGWTRSQPTAGTGQTVYSTWRTRTYIDGVFSSANNWRAIS